MSVIKSGFHRVSCFVGKVYTHTHIYTHICTNQEEVWPGEVKIDPIKSIKYLKEKKEEERKKKGE